MTGLFESPLGAFLVGPNTGNLAGPNAESDNEPVVNKYQLEDVFTPGNSYIADLGEAGQEDQQFIIGNVDRIQFTREWSHADRSKLLTPGKVAIQYINFTTMRKTEYNDWVAEYGQSQIDAYLWTKSSDGTFYGHIENNNEYLCDITNTDWIDFRLARTEDYSSSARFKSCSISALNIDLCPLYPTTNLTLGILPTGVADAAAWKAAMLGMVEAVRSRVDSTVLLICNGLREYLGETGYPLTPNRAYWDDFRGDDLVDPGVRADAIGIEAGVDYTAGGVEIREIWRQLHRAAAAGIPVAASWKLDTSDLPNDADERDRREANLCAHAMVVEDFETDDSASVLCNIRPEQEFSPYPIDHLPENSFEFGAPREAVETWISTDAIPTAGLYTRTFDSGAVALFNYDVSAANLPTEYEVGWKRLTYDPDVKLVNGRANTEPVYEAAPVQIRAGHGIILVPDKALDYEPVHTDNADTGLLEWRISLAAGESTDFLRCRDFDSVTVESDGDLEFKLPVVAEFGNHVPRNGVDLAFRIGTGRTGKIVNPSATRIGVIPKQYMPPLFYIKNSTAGVVTFTVKAQKR